MTTVREAQEHLKQIASMFTKPEIALIYEDLLETSATGKRAEEMLIAIHNDFVENGVPEEDDVEELTGEFIFEAEYVDEENNVNEALLVAVPVKVKKSKTKRSKVQDEEEVELEPEKPPCFSYAEERDPACRGCAVLELCKKARQNNRPVCFGKLFSETAVECQRCMEAGACRAEIKSQ